MDRGSSDGFKTEAFKSQNRPVHLVSVHFDDEVVFMTDSFSDISFGGNNYQAYGGLLSFSDIEEAAEVMVSSVTLGLASIQTAWISRFMNYQYIDRTVKIYTAFLSDNNDLIIDPVLIFEGRMDKPVIVENPGDGTASVSVSATNAWVDFVRITGRHTNHEETQIYFPGDRGFEYASEIVKEITWGA